MGLSLPAIRVVPLTIRAYHSTRACTERITTITLADLAHFARTPSYIAAADFLYPSFPSFFPPRIFVFFLSFFFLPFLNLELVYFSEASSISNFQNYLSVSISFLTSLQFVDSSREIQEILNDTSNNDEN